jgi:hypothetical protein
VNLYLNGYRPDGPTCAGATTSAASGATPGGTDSGA